MDGKIFITSTGYDPQCGKHVNDPYLGSKPSLGACRPDIRRVTARGDYIFTISGKRPGVSQLIMGGFEVTDKMPAQVAYRLFPERRLHLRADGQLDGNIICDANGNRHPLDSHPGFEERLENYVIGQNPVVLVTPDEIARGREETMDILRMLFDTDAHSPIKAMGRARKLSADQVRALLDWLSAIKRGAKSVTVPLAYQAAGH